MHCSVLSLHIQNLVVFFRLWSLLNFKHNLTTHSREYLDNVPLFQGCSEKMLDSISVLLREIQADTWINFQQK